MASERRQVCLAGSLAGSRGSENGKGVWSETGGQQGVDGPSRNVISWAGMPPRETSTDVLLRMPV